MRNRGDLLVAHTIIELPDGTEVAASWYFHPGSPPCYSLYPDPGSGPELEHVEVDGMIVAGNRDCEHKLRAVIGDAAFYAAEEHAMEIAERYGPDPDDARDAMQDESLVDAALEVRR